jgi:hypothetical protein
MTRKIDFARPASAPPAALGETLTRTTADLLAKQVREIERQLADPGGLDSPARGLDFFDAWAAQYRATRIYGTTPWEAAFLEACVIYSGTYRFSPNPLHEPFPGIPIDWLHQGGPHGTDARLRVAAGRALANRVRDIAEKVALFKPRGVLFYVKALPKSQYGFNGVQTAAYSATTCKPNPAEVPSEKVIRLRRAQG